MITLCPFCGTSLSDKLRDGITTCVNCLRIFDSSDHYKVLSAAWAARRWHLDDASVLQRQPFELTIHEAALINEYVIQLLYSHEEFSKILEAA